MADPTCYLLLIGADGYFPNRTSSGGSYPSLRGCVADVTRVEALLTARLRGYRLDPTLLISPAGARGEPTGDPARWPTAANVRRALADVAERARPGDQVYIHYSGHGGRVATTAKQLKGNYGLDEALVPIDIGVPDGPGEPYTRAERYVRDVELALYLDQLARKREGDRRVAVTLVFDSCHSGGVTRGAMVARRSAVGGRPSPDDPAGAIDRHEAAADPAVEHMVAAYQRLRGATPRAAVGTSWLPPAEGYVLLAACRDVESALESSRDGRPVSGVLTSALLEALDALSGQPSWQAVYDRVRAKVYAQFPSQTPQLLGDLDRLVLGGNLAPIEHTLIVTRIDHARGAVAINGGLALTITEGTRFAIYAPGTRDFSRADQRVATATTVEVDAIEARAVVDDPAVLARIEPGAPALVDALPLRRSVELVRRDDLPAAIAVRQDATLAGLADAIARDGSGFVELVAPRATPDYQVAVSPRGVLEICDPQGVPFPYLTPEIAIADARVGSLAVAQLRRLGRYRAVLDLDEPESALREQLEVELLVAPAGWGDRATRNDAGAPLARIGDEYVVPTETSLWLRLTNHLPKQPLNIALLDLTRTWEIKMIVPDLQEMRGQRYETIADRPRTFAFRMFAPVPETLDILKLFVAVDDVDFPALTTSRTMRGPHAPEAPHALGRLIDDITAGQGRWRSGAPARSSSAPWTVYEFRIRTHQRGG